MSLTGCYQHDRLNMYILLVCLKSCSAFGGPYVPDTCSL